MYAPELSLFFFPPIPFFGIYMKRAKRAKRAIVSMGKHLGDGAPKLLQKKAWQTSGGKRVTDLC